MPVYEYQCTGCGKRFEKTQGMNDPPLKECPNCRGELRRLISGGTNFILKGKQGTSGAACSLNDIGRTCCGREERCDSSPCGE